MNKRTLVDVAGSIKIQLTESTVGGKHLIARGEFGRADVPTQNKRVYPRAVWDREIKKIQEAIASGKVLGELDHPADGKTSLKRVSHIITGLQMMDDGTIIGEAKILDNEYGNQLRSILQAGGAIGVSSRGMGSTAMGEDGSEVVQDDYNYMTHDFVADPAVLTSYPKFTTEVKWINPDSVIKENQMEKTVEQVKAEQVETPVVAAPAVVEAPKVESAPVETPVVAEAPVVEAPKVEAAPAPAEVVTEAPVAEAPKVEAAPVDETQVLRESIKKEILADPVFAAAQIALESIKSIVKPFVLPEDFQTVITAKDAEIASLKSMLEDRDGKIKEIGAVANRLGAHLHFERKLGEMKEDRESIADLMKKKRFESVKQVDELLAEAKETVAKTKEGQRALTMEAKRIEAKNESAVKALELKNKQLEESLKNTISLSKELGLRLYIEEKTRGNPHGVKIRQLCEGKTNRKEVDAILERFAVAPKTSEDYNAIKRRFSRVENTTIVEDQLRDTGVKRQPAVSDDGDVLGEMKDLFPGATLDQVEALM